jgi:hypothetical protein
MWTATSYSFSGMRTSLSVGQSFLMENQTDSVV